MRVAMILSTAIPPREGIGFYSWNLANHLREMGHEILFITRADRRRPQTEVIDGFPVYRPSFLPAYPFHVHLHSIFVNRLIRELDDEIDLYHLHSPLPPPITTNKPLLLTVHTSVRNDLKDLQVRNVQQLSMKLQTPVSYFIENQLLRQASAVSVVSTETANVLRTYPGCSTEISVNWNGVNTQLFSPNGKQRQGFVLTTGRLSPVKGLEDLVEAASIVNDRLGSTRFLIVGEGPMQPLLKKKIADAGLQDQVELTGHVSDRSHLADLYRKAALFVSPSHAEGLPTVLLEAMACECPAVATRVGGNPDVISNGENGLLVPPRNPGKLAGAICQMLENHERRTAIGVAGRRTVEERFSWEVITQMYIKQYQKLLEGGAS
jgi:glycosyltransferase involved in cell wall biosynthesis